MNLNKILIAVVVIIIIFAAIFFFQFYKPGTPKTTVTIEGHTFTVEVAQTPAELEKGLSGRNSLPDDQGLLFTFAKAGNHAFWMKDMKFAIDIIFIDKDKIVSIAENATPPKSPQEKLTVYTPGQPVDKVLEIKAGLSKKYGFKAGDSVNVALPK